MSVASVPRTYAGFDSYGYPGDEFMAWAMEHTDLHITGYYLVAPSHPSASWRGKRSTLARQGWGIAPIFVGQEIQGPGDHIVTANEGMVDAAICAERLRDDGFPAWSCAFLDLENGPPDTSALTAYIAAWAAGMRGARYAPGIYCSHLLGASLGALVPDARLWCFRLTAAAQATLRGRELGSMDPAGCGVEAAVGWQHQQNATWQTGSALHPTIGIDLSAWSIADPSASSEDIP